MHQINMKNVKTAWKRTQKEHEHNLSLKQWAKKFGLVWAETFELILMKKYYKNFDKFVTDNNGLFTNKAAKLCLNN